MQRFFKLLSSFLLGVIVLNMFSLMQKFFVLQTLDFVLSPKGYVVPSFFGGLSGLLIRYRGLKIRDLNYQLQIRVQNLEEILPICSVCKKICTNSDASEENREWIDVAEHLAPQKVTHGYCPDCYNEIMKDLDVECQDQTPKPVKEKKLSGKP